MNSYRCGGVRGTGGQENKANRSTDDDRAACLVLRYGRGNFPKKNVRTGIEGVRMGAAVAAASEKIVRAAEISTSSRN